MRKPIIVGNWKMNKLRGDAKEFVCAIEEYLTGEEASTYGIAAPFTCLVECVDNAKNLVVAAQNCHWKESGAFTGEVSVEMLEDVGVTYCVIGHSERRSMFGDTDETVNLKASKLLDENIIPILCIGETEAQYDAGETEKVIREQISGSMKGLCPHCVGKMVVAYEPIWVRVLLRKLLKTAVISFVIRSELCLVMKLLIKFVSNMVEVLNQKILKNIWLVKISMVL